MSDKRSIWNCASKAGLVLGFVCVLYFILGILLGKVNSTSTFALIATSAASFLLWLGKFLLCLWLLMFYMKSFANDGQEDIDRRSVFRFGALVSLLSALVYSGCYLAYVSLIEPDFFAETMAPVLQGLPQGTIDAVEEMIPTLPIYTFFANLIYCWVFGVVLSAIFSRRIYPSNPF